VVGCGDSAPGDNLPTVKVRGKIVRNGVPLKLKEDPKLPLPPGDPGGSITFIHTDGPKIGQEQPGKLNSADGTFEMTGANGKGIPAGKYKVALRVGAFSQPDQLKDNFSYFNTKLEVTVPDGGVSDLVIDLDKK
jgi:hypothetical protein